jgi:hypothetical protein
MILQAEYAWTPVSQGIRTQLFSGPLIHAAPVQWLELCTLTGRGGPTNFTVAVYSASPPWYYTASGTAMTWPTARTNVGTIDLGFPWAVGYPIWLLASPWMQAYVTTDRTCLAQLHIL